MELVTKEEDGDNHSQVN